MSEYGQVHVGLWMQSREEAEIMLRAIEHRLRVLAHNDPDRHQLEIWRKQAMNMPAKSKSQDWTGWAKP
ncbi:MAG: hypothetical protein ABS76_07490 [Pelagibacterium sp. SCN 64-44]|mgnify:CR=1 FL=1|nr:MAG: hypothetical protein ABS76_07490 [Pelagibacterium sp. SCN 64-44]